MEEIDVAIFAFDSDQHLRLVNRAGERLLAQPSERIMNASAAALDLAYVACGRLDGFWEFNLNPWDTSAGYLLVEEAGGTVTHFDGSKFTLDSREVLATNGVIAGEMRHLFAEMFAGRGLGSIPTPAEFAAKRNAAEK